MPKYIESKNIDKSRWDQCVSFSKSPLVYGYSWYLDLVSPGWCGIIMEDYSAVMPLPVKKKYGINYIIQPRFTQQLGIFAPENYGDKEINEFVEAIPRFYRFIDINLNYSNNPVDLSIVKTLNTNYELELSRQTDKIRENYSENTRRNLQKADLEIKITEDIPLNEFLELLRNNSENYPVKECYNWMKFFIENLIQRKAGLILGVFYKDKLCASVFLVNYGGRIYYLIPVSDKTGKEQRAMFVIIDHIIQKYAGSDFILDFEGSNLSGVARFYAGFGAKPVNYPRVRINRLPFLFKLFVRK